MSSPVTHLTDFPDKLSPMLVKELRQGMRARGFTMLFLVFQCLLAFILLSAGASSESESAGQFASGTIFTMFSLAVLVIQPLRGISALSSEITANTIEMMALTRLSAWRIVFGKWIAIVSQSALIMVTIIPYLILRYFYGGMALLGELVFLCLIFLTSMALTAVMVGFSGTSARLIRALPIIAIVVLMNVVPSMWLMRGAGGGMSFFTLSDWDSRLSILAYLFFIAYLGWCSLSYGTSAIAPISENHSTPRRLVAVALAFVAIATGFLDRMTPESMMVVFGIILAPALVIALTEPALLMPPACKPFLRRGLPGRVAAHFLLPGWPSGVFFTILMIVLCLLGAAVSYVIKAPPRTAPDVNFSAGALSLLGGVLFPALLAVIFCKDERKRFSSFLIFMLGGVVLTIAPVILSSMNNSTDLLWLFVWNPPVGLALLAESHTSSKEWAIFVAMVVVNLAITMALLIFALRRMTYFRDAMIEAERESARADAAAEP